MKIICAAIKSEEGVFMGKRHSDCLFLMSRFGVKANPRTEGFMTSGRLFVTRKEAMDMAIEAGQMDKSHKGIELFSEDLY